MTGVHHQHSYSAQGGNDPLGESLAEAEAAAYSDEGGGIDLQETGINITTEKLIGRQRRIVATTHIPFHVEQIWQILTDYDRLADFIPNLTESHRVSHPEGGIRLVQVGAQCFLNVKFCARVVLDMLEVFPKELKFSMVEGDFRQFEGRWLLEPLAVDQNPGTKLSYDLIVLPPRAMPAGLIERHIKRDLGQNLKAVDARAQLLFGK
jgi:ribosome-associated toxin RatA of RatAB toxin-antitoxin module